MPEWQLHEGAHGQRKNPPNGTYQPERQAMHALVRVGACKEPGVCIGGLSTGC